MRAYVRLKKIVLESFVVVASRFFVGVVLNSHGIYGIWTFHKLIPFYTVFNLLLIQFELIFKPLYTDWIVALRLVSFQFHFNGRWFRFQTVRYRHYSCCRCHVIPVGGGGGGGVDVITTTVIFLSCCLCCHHHCEKKK